MRPDDAHLLALGQAMASDRAAQISPWTRTRPSSPVQLTTSPVLPIICSAPVRTGRWRARTAKPSMPSEEGGAQDRHAATTCQETLIGISALGIEQEQRADDEGDNAAEARRRRSPGERLGHHQADTEEQQARPA